MRIASLLALAACGGKPDAPPAPATIEVAGKRLAVQTALVHGTHVIVSTGKIDCALTTQSGEVILSRGELGWSLGGSLFPQLATAKLDPGARLEVVGRTVELGGTIKFGTHELVLSGSIPAIDCPEP